jgi:glycosyltransferase involved in cell wall biosynthesis
MTARAERLTAVVLTHNAAGPEFERVLGALAFCGEILVIDDMSTDATPETAARCGAKVLRRALAGDFGAQRRFGIEQASGDWILFVDSDETVSEKLAESIASLVNSGKRAAGRVKRENRFLYHAITHGSMRSDTVLRLFPRDAVTVRGLVHETFVTDLPEVRLAGPLYHCPYRTWNDMIRKLDAYTESWARERRGRPVGVLRDMVLRPTWALIKVYIFNGGFLDGRMGWMFAVHHAYYTFMKYAKLYLLNRSDGRF